MKPRFKQIAALLMASVMLVLTGCSQSFDANFKNSLKKDSDITYINELTEGMISDPENTASGSDENQDISQNGGYGDENNSTGSAGGEEEEGGNSFGSASETLRFTYPLSMGMTDSASPTFKWTAISDATYKLNVKEYSGSSWKTVINVSGLTGTSYRNSSVLKEGGIYRAIVTAVTADGETECLEAVNDGLLFMNYINPKTHPANKGIDYTFNGKITEKVLNNYLDRAVTCELSTRKDLSVTSEEEARNKIREILNIGVKYVSRAYGGFKVGTGTVSESSLNFIKELITEAHAVDPDIIFEAGIFETTSESVNSIAIPDWVFEAFNLTPENRNFDYEKMLFPDGYGLNAFGEGLHTPDITQLETQMHFYYLACTYIDLGFEAFHMGQTWLMAKTDRENDYECYDKLFSMIRRYAKQNARRGMILINSHNSTSPMKNKSGVLLIDFLVEPAAIYDVSDTPHLPSENNPQKAEIRQGAGVWSRRYSGVTPSGWYTTNLPCYAEFDNWMNEPDSIEELMSPTGRVDVPWGFDEISWFANQPTSYRHSFMDYMYKTVKSFNENAHVCFSLSRPIYSLKSHEMTYYYASSSVFSGMGYDDEQALKSVYINGRK